MTTVTPRVIGESSAYPIPRCVPRERRVRGAGGPGSRLGAGLELGAAVRRCGWAQNAMNGDLHVR